MGTDERAESRTVRVDPARLPGWLDRFVAAHGTPAVEVLPDGVRLTSPDGAQARLAWPWGLPEGDADPLAALLVEATRPRRFGVLLVRKGAHAVGIFDAGRLVASKVGTHYVQGRTKAGGWSQQRYARRRGHQAERAFAAAAVDAGRLLLPEVATLAALVRGGDAAAVAAVLSDPALARLAALPGAAWGVLPTAEPRLAVLQEFGRTALAVPIRLNAAAALPSAPDRDDGAGEE